MPPCGGYYRAGRLLDDSVSLDDVEVESSLMFCTQAGITRDGQSSVRKLGKGRYVCRGCCNVCGLSNFIFSGGEKISLLGNLSCARCSIYSLERYWSTRFGPDSLSAWLDRLDEGSGIGKRRGSAPERTNLMRWRKGGGEGLYPHPAPVQESLADVRCRELWCGCLPVVNGSRALLSWATHF